MITITQESKIRQIRFYMDYLRLHRLGKKLKMFPKNRQMMDPELAWDTKKGFIAYVLRMVQTFLKKDFTYLTTVKPRGIFGYNFGLRVSDIQNASAAELNIFDSKENLLLYMFRRWLIYGDNIDLIDEYFMTLGASKHVEGRTYNIFYNLRLDDNKCNAYEGMAELYKVRDKHFEILNRFDVDQCIKNSIHSILTKTRLPKRGQKFITKDGDERIVAEVIHQAWKVRDELGDQHNKIDVEFIYDPDRLEAIWGWNQEPEGSIDSDNVNDALENLIIPEVEDQLTTPGVTVTTTDGTTMNITINPDSARMSADAIVFDESPDFDNAIAGEYTEGELPTVGNRVMIGTPPTPGFDPDCEEETDEVMQGFLAYYLANKDGSGLDEHSAFQLLRSFYRASLSDSADRARMDYLTIERLRDMENEYGNDGN